MKIYFAGAIRGGREKVEDYAKIVAKLQEYGEVLTVHVASDKILNEGEKNLSAKEIYDRDIAWLEQSDVVVAEVTVPSLGVGYELAYAEKIGKRVICFFDEASGKKLSAMIGGDNYFKVFNYKSISEILNTLDEELN